MLYSSCVPVAAAGTASLSFSPPVTVYAKEVHLARMVMPRSRSSGFESIVSVKSGST